MSLLGRIANRARRAAFCALYPSGIPVEMLDQVLKPLLPIKTRARHQFLTLARSVDAPEAVPARLLDLALRAAELVPSIDLPVIHERMLARREEPEMREALDSGFRPLSWPGEHYRLLAALVRITKATNVVEIGTHWGLGTLALAAALPEGGRVTSYDILPWDSSPAAVLVREDFERGVVQVLGDLSEPAFFESQRAVLENADLIFMDAAKDGVMERVFLRAFATCRFTRPTLLVVDDIRLWNMLDIWDEISLPKLDITSLGHYTGTGLVELAAEGTAS